MTSYEPPNGFPDLAGQVDSVEAERAAAARERAAHDEQMALVRQRRAHEDQQHQQHPQVIGPDAEPFQPRTPEPSYAPSVVDSEGSEFELDLDTGQPILDDAGKPIPKWPHQTIELDGQIIQVRKPRPEALQAVALATSKYTPAQMQNNLIGLFVQNHISPLSYGRLMVRMLNPEDNSFTVEDFGRLFQAIAALETGRPTGPSRG